MLGAIIGDIVGSRFEWDNHKNKDFDFFTKECFVTDDTIMTLAIAKALMECKEDYSDLSKKATYCMKELGVLYPDCGYGNRFNEWMFSSCMEPYNSYGNGAAMRISPVGFVAKSLDEVIMLSDLVTKVTHNHPEGLKGAEATAVAIYMAKNGSDISEIKEYIDEHYYKLDFTLDEIRDEYEFNETCQGSVPQALEAFFESVSFEDAIRNAISLGGDSDTIAAICGGVSEAYYGIPKNLEEEALKFMDDRLLAIYKEFNLR